MVAPGPRPLLRGVSHRVAFYVTLLAGGIFVATARDLRTLVATAIYVVLLAAMFGVSATLHHADWGPRAFGILRRADHAVISACIAGTYTPLCLLGLPASSGTRLLTLSWSASALGILRAVLWPHAPRLVSSALYIAVGWVMIAYLPEVRQALDPAAFVLFMAGGALFTVGAAVYLFRRPDPWPQVFGYHEVFHVFIILGCTCHFVAVVLVARA